MSEIDDSAALRDVAAERARQINIKGWTPAHDDEHAFGELAAAAALYALPPRLRGLRFGFNGKSVIERCWPFAQSGWKPKDRRRDLVRAAALIVAEIERLDREADRARGKT